MLFLIIFTINFGIATYFVYCHWHLKKDVTRIKFGTRKRINWTSQANRDQKSNLLFSQRHDQSQRF